MDIALTSDKVSIRWKLCIYFVGFSLSLLLILWFLQTVLLDSIYAVYTEKSMRNHAATIAENINNLELDSLLISISQENELSAYILYETGMIRSATERSTSVRLVKAPDEMFGYWDLASKNGGTYVTKIESGGVFTDSGDFLKYDPTHFVGDVPEKNDYSSVIVATEVLASDGERFLIILLSRIEPIDSMGDVLMLILSIASVFAFSIGIIFAYVISKDLASPIKNLSDSAGKLANGDYETVFEGGGCREIAQLSETLNNTAKKLGKTEKLRRELLANVSHDLRTPLTMIGGYGEMMRDIPGENNSENIQIIIDETKRLTKLVNDALDLSKLQSGTFNFCPRIFCVTDEAYDIVTQFEKLSGGKHRISFINSGDVYINADETLVSEAIYNLVNNAVNHSGESSEITVRQEIIGENVRISVIDNGCGIPQKLLEDIWERYQKGKGGGTGLGLAIVSTAVKMCGGTCGVESEVGKGSTFWIEFKTVKE